MRTQVDHRLRAEARRFAFRFACEDCAHFDAGGERCSLDYPPSPRRCELDLEPPVQGIPTAHGDASSFLELCKAFELG